MKIPHGRTRFWLAALVLLASGGARAAVLGPGQSMQPEQRLYSSDASHFAMLSHDGVFAVYRHADGRAVWSTRTRGSGAVSVDMSRGGRLILTDTLGKTVWTTGTRGRHRVFGVMNGGTAVVLKAKKWKPQDKNAEPFIEEMLKRRAYLEWQARTVPEVRPPKRARPHKRAQ